MILFYFLSVCAPLVATLAATATSTATTLLHAVAAPDVVTPPSPQDSGASSELHVEANGDGPSEALAHKPLVKPNTMQSTTPLANAVPNGAPPPAAAVTAGGIPADVGIPPAAPRAFGPANLADAGVVLPSGRGAVAGAGVGDNSSSSTSVSFAGGSVADSSDSASEFSAASSASTAWTADGFQTPARTDIPRGSGGIRCGWCWCWLF